MYGWMDGWRFFCLFVGIDIDIEGSEKRREKERRESGNASMQKSQTYVTLV